MFLRQYSILEIMKKSSHLIEDLHFEHRLWTSDLSFYSDEMQVFTTHLNLIGNRGDEIHSPAQLKKFKKEFEALGKTLMKLQKEISEHEHVLAGYEKKGEKKDHSDLLTTHAQARSNFEEFKKKYSSLKKDFLQFLEINK